MKFLLVMIIIFHIGEPPVKIEKYHYRDRWECYGEGVDRYVELREKYKDKAIVTWYCVERRGK